MTSHITETKLKNKRFKKTEIAILMAFSSVKGILSVSRLIKVACISRSTFYRHHKTIYEIIPDYEKFILKKYRSYTYHLIKIKSIRLKTLYERTLTFMVAYREILQFLYEHGSTNLNESMLLLLKPKIISVSKISHPEIFDIYIKEVATVINKWQQDGFNKNEISPTVHKIMYLTDTARTRLGPVVDIAPPSSRNPPSMI